jgi:DNA-binding LacI/PurR family transcriptional regulator
MPLLFYKKKTYFSYLKLYSSMSEGQATLKDIAEKLGISISTVSRALKNHPDVNSETKKAVLDLASAMDYEPNLLALNLLKKQSNLIGVIVPKLSYHLYAMVISGIEEVVEKEGFHLLICQTNESYEKEVAILREFNAIRPAGYLISLASETSDFDHLKQLQRKNIPLVFFNRDCEEVIAPKVIIDNRKAAYNAVIHLHQQGYKKIAFLAGPENVQISNHRIAGYKQALEKYNLKQEVGFIQHANFTREDASDKTHVLLSLNKKPDAIIAFSDQIAISAMLAIKDAGYSIPDDIAVMGFNNEPGDMLMEPALTSIDQPALEMGKKAAEMLLAQIRGSGAAKTVVLQSELITRKSTMKL